ncbi:aldolase catalytic domain-containing protein [Succinivibrio dextrinosolvens]|uniref:aldolase catalytic domain-containing protein n=1 Tax=Succinivibrio dextrinosolvens TaxID=83771 RepID=UPI0004E27F58|nr:aldolase catalytic domain-containing protein [Succinivibrio dextrinosolvens]
MEFDILDCTLRDGGYVNGWMFSNEISNAIIDGLYRAGVRWIEIGLMGNSKDNKEKTKFNSFEQIKPLLLSRRKDCYYAVMVTTSSSDEFIYPKRSELTPDVIRIAFFKPEIAKTFDLAQRLISLGYMVFLQPMATFMYSDKELEELILMVNRIQPFGMYMVDSFSTMYPKDIIEMEDKILSILDKNIIFGLHAHNNIQMAFANAQAFISNAPNDRKILIDASIYGMGRGAGNVPAELLLSYCNSKYNRKYDVSFLLELFDKYFKTIYQENSWGYSLPYFLTSINKMNSVWAWFFMQNGILDLSRLDKAFNLVPFEQRYTLNAVLGKEIIEKVCK